MIVEDFVAGPRILENGTTMADESTLNFTVTLHGITQTRCIILPKATDNALRALGKTSLVVSSVQIDTKIASWSKMVDHRSHEAKQYTRHNKNTPIQYFLLSQLCLLNNHHHFRILLHV